MAEIFGSHRGSYSFQLDAITDRELRKLLVGIKKKESFLGIRSYLMVIGSRNRFGDTFGFDNQSITRLIDFLLDLAARDRIIVLNITSVGVSNPCWQVLRKYGN